MSGQPYYTHYCYAAMEGICRAGRMETNQSNRSLWRFIDGSLAVSASMLVAVVISKCQSCAGLWGIGFLKGLTDQNDGVIILATLLLFPTTLALYGVLKMWFAAKEAIEKKAAEKGRRQERERISRALAERGIIPPPEIARILADESETDRSCE